MPPHVFPEHIPFEDGMDPNNCYVQQQNHRRQPFFSLQVCRSMLLPGNSASPDTCFALAPYTFWIFVWLHRQWDSVPEWKLRGGFAFGIQTHQHAGIPATRASKPAINHDFLLHTVSPCVLSLCVLKTPDKLIVLAFSGNTSCLEGSSIYQMFMSQFCLSWDKRGPIWHMGYRLVN